MRTLDDVARRLATHADRPIDIVYTGLRPGEKLHEVLLGATEVDDRPFHPLISQVPVPPLTTASLEVLVGAADGPELVALLDALQAVDPTADLGR